MLVVRRGLLAALDVGDPDRLRPQLLAAPPDRGR